jgi:hypothetical protein
MGEPATGQTLAGRRAEPSELLKIGFKSGGGAVLQLNQLSAILIMAVCTRCQAQ